MGRKHAETPCVGLHSLPVCEKESMLILFLVTCCLAYTDADYSPHGSGYPGLSTVGSHYGHGLRYYGKREAEAESDPYYSYLGHGYGGHGYGGYGQGGYGQGSYDYPIPYAIQTTDA